MQERPETQGRPRRGAGDDERKRRQMRQQMRRGYQEMADLNLALSQEGPVFEAEVQTRPPRRRSRSGEAPDLRGQVGWV